MKQKSKPKPIVAHPSIRCPLDPTAIRIELGHNAQLLIEAIAQEQTLAEKENRFASSTRAIALFEARMDPKMSGDQICALWDWVFYYFCQWTGSSVSNLHGFGMS